MPRTVYYWNRYHNIGDPVYYWPGGRMKPHVYTRIRSDAYDTPLGPVIRLVGIDGAVPLELVTDDEKGKIEGDDD